MSVDELRRAPVGLQNLQERTHAVSQIRTIMFVCNIY